MIEWLGVIGCSSWNYILFQSSYHILISVIWSYPLIIHGVADFAAKVLWCQNCSAELSPFLLLSWYKIYWQANNADAFLPKLNCFPSPSTKLWLSDPEHVLPLVDGFSQNFTWEQDEKMAVGSHPVLPSSPFPASWLLLVLGILLPRQINISPTLGGNLQTSHGFPQSAAGRRIYLYLYVSHWTVISFLRQIPSYLKPPILLHY